MTTYNLAEFSSLMQETSNLMQKASRDALQRVTVDADRYAKLNISKTFNKMISKIPVLGDIIIPKEAGEGLFGISFKIKGPAGDIKTTINPIIKLRII